MNDGVAGESKVSSTVDFAANGKHFGRLSIPHSRDESGWGAVHLPIVSIRNGDGPVLVFTGGNHGDEYEGPIALMKLVRALNPGEINGQIIVIPALNFPAVMAGTRVSPIDGVNMNRAFPGRRDGSVSQMIAHFLQHNILPRCDAVCDIHSGGKSMYFAPFAAYHNLPNKLVMKKARAAMLAFGAPISLELEELSKLWSVFLRVPYDLSIAYRASVVLISADVSPQVALPVRLQLARLPTCTANSHSACRAPLLGLDSRRARGRVRAGQERQR